MILIPKKGSNEIKYDSELAKKLDYVIIVNDIDSSNVGDLFSIWNQKCKVTICNDITDYYDFIKKEKKFNLFCVLPLQPPPQLQSQQPRGILDFQQFSIFYFEL